MAASSCQLLWFLHLAAKARIDVVEYEDRAEAEMPEDRLTAIALRPRIVVDSDAPEERIVHLCELAHEQCNIAKSLETEVALDPRIERR
jgi:organic hydroperoxide reductase OsmC/OhrA